MLSLEEEEVNGRFSHESVMGGGVLLPFTHEVGSYKIDRWPPLSVPKKESRSFSQKREPENSMRPYRAPQRGLLLLPV